ncbi:UNVERIFIED_CONTAM: hypothetical protein LK11_69985 [Mumia flava]
MAIQRVQMLPRDGMSLNAVRAERGAPPAWLSEVRARETVSHVQLLSLAERIHKAERELARLACLDHVEVSIEFKSFDEFAVSFEAKRAELRALYVDSCR